MSREAWRWSREGARGGVKSRETLQCVLHEGVMEGERGVQGAF